MAPGEERGGGGALAFIEVDVEDDVLSLAIAAILDDELRPVNDAPLMLEADAVVVDVELNWKTD